MSAVDQISGEYDAVTGAAGFVRRAQPGLLKLSGDDAGEFLQGQVTNDVQDLSPGEGRYAALLTPKGKMRADMRVLRSADATLVLCEAVLLPVIRHTIDTFRIGYFFTTDDISGQSALLSVIGPNANDAAESAAAPIPAGAENSLSEDGDVLAIRTLVGIDFIGPQAAIEDLAARLVESGTTEVSKQAAEIVRVEHAIPIFGAEVDENTIPGEAGLNERAVSFEKGCYVGQETVARMHYKGKPNRSLRGMRSEQPLATGATVTASDGRELGTIGTAVVSPAYGSIALAVLRREAESGDIVDANGVPARVLNVDEFPAG